MFTVGNGAYLIITKRMTHPPALPEVKDPVIESPKA